MLTDIAYIMAFKIVYKLHKYMYNVMIVKQCVPYYFSQALINALKAYKQAVGLNNFWIAMFSPLPIHKYTRPDQFITQGEGMWNHYELLWL